MTVASHTHCHFKSPFKKQDKSFVSPSRNLIWKELLAYGTSIHFTVRSQPAKSKKNSRLYLLDWVLPPVLAKKLHLTGQLVLDAYNLLHPQNTTLMQTITHARCRFVIKNDQHPSFPITNPSEIPSALPNSLYCHNPSHTFHSLTKSNNGSFCAHPFLFAFNFFYIYIYIYIHIIYIYIYIYIYIHIYTYIYIYIYIYNHV